MPLFEIYEDSMNEDLRRKLSRKLALVIFYINTRTEQGSALNFRHGGVWSRRWDGYDYSRIKSNFIVVVNKKYILDNVPFLADDRYGEDDIRACCELLGQQLGLIDVFGVYSSWRWIISPNVYSIGGFYPYNLYLGIFPFFDKCREYITYPELGRAKVKALESGDTFFGNIMMFGKNYNYRYKFTDVSSDRFTFNQQFIQGGKILQDQNGAGVILSKEGGYYNIKYRNNETEFEGNYDPVNIMIIGTTRQYAGPDEGKTGTFSISSDTLNKKYV